MRSGSGRAGVAQAAAASLFGREFHFVCGKFCVQVSRGARKALESGMLQSFELKRSKCVNRLSSNGLSYRMHYGDGAPAGKSRQMNLPAISTVRGGR